MNILVLNAGSSSLKYQLINMENESILAKGSAEKIGNKDSFITHKYGNEKIMDESFFENHEVVVDNVLNFLTTHVISSIDEIKAIGHRIVHGGELFKHAAIIDDSVIKGIEDCSDLAPLHNPAHLKGIYACKKLNIPMVAVFDTAFHQTMPEECFIYPIPYEFYEKYKIRKYGFHGTSHKYVSQRASEILEKNLDDLNIITCHLGNGASLCAIKNGKSYNTSMGFTPLAGVMMGTRSGDIDPAIISYLMEKENLTSKQIDDILNKKSGLLGISGISNDCRDIENEAWNNGNKRAQLALDKFGLRVKETLGSYAAILNGVDAIVFTAGLGEMSPETREFICKDLEHFGIKLDYNLNKSIRGKEAIISSSDSKTTVLVVPTNEELMIARETMELVSQ
ncbi:MAG: acetate kinase [Candidatus Nanoarchaeia archaeon]|nr:acetate kinase [Candidatus Nanoarchaeia archaeon]